MYLLVGWARRDQNINLNYNHYDLTVKRHANIFFVNA